MNFTITSATLNEHVDESTITYNSVKFIDKTYQKYTNNEIVTMVSEVPVGSYKVFAYTTNLESAIPVFAVFDLIELKKQGFKYSMTLKRISEMDNDDNELIFSSGVIACSVEEYVYDIPSGSAAGALDDLSAKASVYAHKHQPKLFADVIRIEDIITDLSETDTKKQHYFSLQHTPIVEEMVYMEVNGVNYYEEFGDIVIDRENKRIYFDTEEDEFTFSDLQASTDVVRVFYKYVP